MLKGHAFIQIQVKKECVLTIQLYVLDLPWWRSHLICLVHFFRVGQGASPNTSLTLFNTTFISKLSPVHASATLTKSVGCWRVTRVYHTVTYTSMKNWVIVILLYLCKVYLFKCTRFCNYSSWFCNDQISVRKLNPQVVT